MIIDCHGHYTTAPEELQVFRDKIAYACDPATNPEPSITAIADDQIRAGIEGAQLKQQRERGTDVTLFSPRALAMGHHIGDSRGGERLGAPLQRSHPPRLHPVSGQVHRRLPAASGARRLAPDPRPRARALRAAARRA